MSDSNPIVISVDRLTKSYRKKEEVLKVLDNISFDVKRGSFTSIIGPSGCGKTTLLRIIDGLVKPDSGKVIFDGAPVTSPPEKMGFVFQQFGLLPWRNIQKNVEFGLELRNVDQDERRDLAKKYIEVVGLKDMRIITFTKYQLGCNRELD